MTWLRHSLALWLLSVHQRHSYPPKGLNGGITEGVAVRDLYHKPSEFPQQDASIVELIKLIMIRIWTKNPK